MLAEAEVKRGVEAAPNETASLDGGLTWGTTTDPYRKPKTTPGGALTFAAGVARTDPVSGMIAGSGRKATGTAGITYGVSAWVADKQNSDELGSGLSGNSTGTSIFDPVLCELVYRWFCPPGGLVLDPFAGGSVRGIVASQLGRQYVGIDLRPEQLDANREQAAQICGEPQPVWHEGDSRSLARICPDVRADLIFSCPPYADLERYSDDPRDLSTMDYPAFRAAYGEVIAAAAALLRPDRFACFVVGDARGRDGFYYGFPWHTVEAFERAGLRLYNEAVLVTAAGSLPLRAGRQFAAARKFGKTHQNVLVFCKGDPRAATEAIGEVDFGDGLDEPAEGEVAAPEDGAPAELGGEV